MDHPTTAPQTSLQAEPWWRVGMVWLVLSGPAVVVVAGVATAVIAIRGADPEVNTPAQRAATAQAPAVRARNHAATPVPGR
ncbi:MAG: nitrogen fixation protein FixH [Aquabacterium sp.]